MKRILAIIDLQNHYLGGIDNRVALRMIDYIHTLLILQKYDLIINLSYDDYFGSSTNKRVRDILKTMRNVVYMTKDINDGSDQILDAIHAKGLRTNSCKFEIVGINTDACVIDTVHGLSDYCDNIHIHAKGVASGNGIHYSENAIVKMVKHYKVSVIRG